MSSNRSAGEFITTFIKQFPLPVQTCLRIVRADRESVESRNSAMIVLSDANLSQQRYSLIMSSLVSTTKHKVGSIIKSTSFLVDKAERAISLSGQLNKSSL